MNDGRIILTDEFANCRQLLAVDHTGGLRRRVCGVFRRDSHFIGRSGTRRRDFAISLLQLLGDLLPGRRFCLSCR
jgi:hypothetical protein